ncbi:MAG: hypothetical protein IJC55_02860 [Clostridia bacterium]|nr:hypothetical protein [Clostridia bacterium]
MQQKFQKRDLYSLLADASVCLSTDRGNITLCHTPQVFENNQYSYETDFCRVVVSVYDKGSQTVYRNITITCKEDLVLYRIDLLMQLPKRPNEFIEYKTLINAPAAALIRYQGTGLFTGAENPFFRATLQKETVCISYEPSLILKKGETYQGDPQFLGSYSSTGKMVKEKPPVTVDSISRGIKRPRFFNPCGAVALDLGEINAMRNYVKEYYDVIQKQFDNILYFFFYPKKQLPQTEQEVQDYLDSIDRFCQLDGTVVAFNPHVNTVLPTAEQPFWEMAPEGSAAQRILRYAQDKGLRCGYYMGTAFNGYGGNAALLPFMPQEKAWKKVDSLGNVAKENCLGCDEYLDWWYTVQANTIERYDLGYWSWDPGPGNGNDCYATNHGHLPGKGEYKGWRNSMRLLERLKTRFPQLFLMSFYGRKEYGIWGFRWFSQHEVFWEETLSADASLHSDPHDDRQIAHGIRLQNQWCMDFRFQPSHLGHGLVTKMSDMYCDPALDQVYDHGGWKTALLSSIACCGSVTHCSLPDRLENIPGFAEFHRKWIKWATENYHYCNFTRPIEDTVSNEVIDGFARIDRDRGQIFLFNSSPKVIRKKLPLTQQLGLDTDRAFYFDILHYDGLDIEQTPLQYGGTFHMGDVLDITLPAYACVVLSLSDTKGQAIDTLPCMQHTIHDFRDESGKEFECCAHKSYERVILQAQAVFHKELKQQLDVMHPENEDQLRKKIDEWRKDDSPFTFFSALPCRLPVYFAFDGVNLPRSVRFWVNDTEISVEALRLREIPVSYYAFIEDFVLWDTSNQLRVEIENLAENSFLGLYVEYADTCQGMTAKQRVFEENNRESPLHFDDTLRIDSFTLTPDFIADIDSLFTVNIKTSVAPQKIESVYFLHPTIAQMPALCYDAKSDVWTATFNTGERCRNIFCNSTLTAWIHTKDGGVGPRATCKIDMHYQQ